MAAAAESGDESVKNRFYESYATTHTLHRKGRPTARSFAAKAGAWDARLGSVLPADRTARIVDVGCGSGSVVWWLQSRGFTSAEGIDVSAEQVQLARDAGVENVEVADLRPWLLDRHGAYDLIFLRDVLEHFDREQAVGLLELIRGALSPHGRVVIQVPNAESPLFGRVRYGDCTHELAFTPSSLAQLFGVVGFEIDRLLPVPPVVPRPRVLHRFLLWKLVEAVYRVIGYAEGAPYARVVTQNIIAVGRAD
jgi:2-polyprenyl-3-methyl-5-hydroxy-6-metoxy-1,4-benzoquinol methylase